MNWRLGLRRISAVFWGFWAVLAVIAAIIIASDEARSNSIAHAAGYAIAIGGFLVGLTVLAHRVTCWIVDGFFAAKQ